MRHVISRALLSLMIFLPASGSAQTPAPLGTREAAFQELNDSQWVRVASAALDSREGRLLAHSGTELVLAAEPQPLRIPATSIDTLWTKGRATKTGALIFGLLGAGLGVVAASQAVEEGETAGAGWYLAIGGGGALAGGLLGALIGSALPRWNRVYPR